MIGVVTGAQIGKNKDGTADRVLLQVMFSPLDVKTIELFQQQGEDFTPALGSRVFVAQASDSYKVAIASCDNVAPESSFGEKEIYSTDPVGLTKLARVKLDATGLINISNQVESLIGLVGDLIDAISDLQTFGSPTAHKVLPDDQIALALIKIRFELLFTE
jgi:hypothetical protein